MGERILAEGLIPLAFLGSYYVRYSVCYGYWAELHRVDKKECFPWEILSKIVRPGRFPIRSTHGFLGRDLPPGRCSNSGELKRYLHQLCLHSPVVAAQKPRIAWAPHRTIRLAVAATRALRGRSASRLQTHGLITIFFGFRGTRSHLWRVLRVAEICNPLCIPHLPTMEIW